MPLKTIFVCNIEWGSGESGEGIEVVMDFYAVIKDL